MQLKLFAAYFQSTLWIIMMPLQHQSYITKSEKLMWTFWYFCDCCNKHVFINFSKNVFLKIHEFILSFRWLAICHTFLQEYNNKVWFHLLNTNGCSIAMMCMTRNPMASPSSWVRWNLYADSTKNSAA